MGTFIKDAIESATKGWECAIVDSKQEGFEVDRAIQFFNQDLPSNDFQEGYLQSLLYMRETCDA